MEKEIEIALIDIPAILMRDEEDDEGIVDLAQDIAANTLINAITVRPKGNRYELVAGRRRLKAHIFLKRATIRAVVRELTDEEAFAIMAAENFARKDLDPIEEAVFCAKLLESGKLQIDDVARIVRQSTHWVNERMDILTYPEYLIAYIKQKKIPLGVAKYLGAITDDVYRSMYVEQAVHYGTTVLQAEYVWRQWSMGLLAPGATIVPPNNAELGAETPKIKVVCRKCGKYATSPNLENVFIHLECPPDVQEAPR